MGFPQAMVAKVIAEIGNNSSLNFIYDHVFFFFCISYHISSFVSFPGDHDIDAILDTLLSYCVSSPYVLYLTIIYINLSLYQRNCIVSN